MSRHLVAKVMKEFNDTKTTLRKSGSGKKNGPSDKKLDKKIVAKIKSKCGMSVRD